MREIIHCATAAIVAGGVMYLVGYYKGGMYAAKKAGEIFKTRE